MLILHVFVIITHTCACLLWTKVDLLPWEPFTDLSLARLYLHLKIAAYGGQTLCCPPQSWLCGWTAEWEAGSVGNGIPCASQMAKTHSVEENVSKGCSSRREVIPVRPSGTWEAASTGWPVHGQGSEAWEKAVGIPADLLKLWHRHKRKTKTIRSLKWQSLCCGAMGFDTVSPQDCKLNQRKLWLLS